MKVIYVADDGTQFSEIATCKEYEKDRADIKKWDMLRLIYNNSDFGTPADFVIDRWDEICAIMGDSPVERLKQELDEYLSRLDDYTREETYSTDKARAEKEIRHFLEFISED